MNGVLSVCYGIEKNCILIPNTRKLTTELQSSWSMEKNSCATILQYYHESEDTQVHTGRKRWSEDAYKNT